MAKIQMKNPMKTRSKIILCHRMGLKKVKI